MISLLSLQLQKCIGTAVIAIGPERILELVPISLNASDFTCSNIWLVPILKDYVVGASLGYYMEHIMPLAKSFCRASGKGIFFRLFIYETKLTGKLAYLDLCVCSCNALTGFSFIIPSLFLFSLFFGINIFFLFDVHTNT